MNNVGSKILFNLVFINYWNNLIVFSPVLFRILFPIIFLNIWRAPLGNMCFTGYSCAPREVVVWFWDGDDRPHEVDLLWAHVKSMPACKVKRQEAIHLVRAQLRWGGEVKNTCSFCIHRLVYMVSLRAWNTIFENVCVVLNGWHPPPEHVIGVAGGADTKINLYLLARTKAEIPNVRWKILKYNRLNKTKLWFFRL